MADDLVIATEEYNEKNSKLVKTGRYLKIIWTVIRNVIYVALIFLAFAKATTDFENITLCLLILVLESVKHAHTTQIRTAIEEAFSHRHLFFTLLKRAGENVDEEEALVKEEKEKYLRLNPQYYINIVFGALVYLIVLWKIFATLF
jgi:protein-S-isoprenylcysteine O-methyltransferase Ste14